MEITVVVASFFFFSFERNQIFIFFYFSQRVPVQLLPSDGQFGNQQPRKLGGTNRLYFCITDRLQCLPLPFTKKKKKKTRIDHFEINWKWHPVINWQNLEKRKRKKIWRLIEAGGHVSARLGSTQSEQTPMISSSQEWEKRKLGRRRRRTELTRTDRLGVLYGIILEVLRRDYCHAAAERKKKKKTGTWRADEL